MVNEKGPVPAPEMPGASGGILGFIRGNVIRYVLVAILPSLVFLMVLLFGNLCLSLIALPLIVVILLWLFRISNLWHQIGLGVVAILIGGILLAAVNVAIVVPISGESIDGVLTNGNVNPFRGTADTQYTFTVTVHATSNATVVNAFVNISGYDVQNPLNLSMTLTSHNTNNTIRNYSVTTTVRGPVNNFVYWASTDGSWHGTIAVDGPLAADSVALFGAVAYTTLIWILGYCFIPLLIMILFMRMSSKSKVAREKMMADYMKKKEQMKPLDKGAKAADGAATATEETFVCSECGSEVRATAKFCPNCGEPFDEDEVDSGSDKRQ